MKHGLRIVSDVLDVISALATIGAVVFLFATAHEVTTGPIFMQYGLFSLMLAVIPYCLAGAVHRMWKREAS